MTTIDDLVWEEPAGPEPRRGSHVWDHRLRPLMERPGEWARVNVREKDSAQKGACALRKRRQACPPPGRWDFRAAPLADGSGKWGIYARYLGPEESAAPPQGRGIAALIPDPPPQAPPKTLAQVLIRNPCRVEACTRPKPHARTRWCTDTGYAQRRAGTSERDAPTKGRAAEAPENVTPEPVLGRQAAARPSPADPLRAVVEVEADPDEVERRARMERAIAQATGRPSRLLDRMGERKGGR